MLTKECWRTAWSAKPLVSLVNDLFFRWCQVGLRNKTQIAQRLAPYVEKNFYTRTEYSRTTCLESGHILITDHLAQWHRPAYINDHACTCTYDGGGQRQLMCSNEQKKGYF